ncbi:transposase [Nonomuraea diastatica]|uniref:IS110 family transposase n=1 Tax=Nonomuraea diastatica TaxID=1848329 RepID=A0A4R4VBG1_9ACTN|nr:transposase [Nonomuraea diastatica]TDD02472.1 IS110 family transposase [Nonomuraea diastatica]
MARGRLRNKAEDLVMACEGRFTEEHAAMAQLHLDAYDHLTRKIGELDALIATTAAPYADLIGRLMTIPGIGLRSAEVIVAETGGDMTRFPSPKQLAAWAGLAPANRESAGKRMRAGTRQGNKHLKAALTEATWAASRTPTRIGARFRRLARRFGKDHAKKAATAVAHTLLRIAWAIMAQGGVYREDGADFYDRREARHAEHIAARSIATLQRLGYQVSVVPPNPATPDPPQETTA